MTKSIRIADSAGVFGAVFAALCCAGLPLIVSVLAVLGFSFIRTDAILLPLMGISLAIAMWGFWRDRRLHNSSIPIVLAIVGAAMLVAGVVYVHGPLAKILIGSGAIALVSATLWNIALRRTCERKATAKSTNGEISDPSKAPRLPA